MIYAKKVKKKKAEWPAALLQLESYRTEYNDQKNINENLVLFVTSALKSEYQVQKIYKKFRNDKIKDMLKNFQKQILEFESVYDINDASTLRTNQNT